MEGKTEEEVERYAKVFKARYKELNGIHEAFFCVNVLKLYSHDFVFGLLQIMTELSRILKEGKQEFLGRMRL